MSAHDPGVTRAVALVGPPGNGKTALLEAMLVAAGAKAARAGGVGDTSPEAKARGHSVELNIASFDYLEDRYAVVDCPGAVDFVAEGDFTLPGMDLAVVVATPDPAKAVLLQPTMKLLERLGVPRVIFVNRMEGAQGPVGGLMEALSSVSEAPVVARQLPTWKGDHISGYVDLALERQFEYRDGGIAERVDLAGDIAAEEKDARFHMLEQIADYDDTLLEKLVSDEEPERELVFADLVRELNEGLICPVFFGDTAKGYGVERLLKALRHDSSRPDAAEQRLGVTGAGAYVLKISHAGQAGKLAFARVLGGVLNDGADVVLSSGDKGRVGGLFSIQGPTHAKIASARPGDVIAIGKLEDAKAGHFISVGAKAQEPALAPEPRAPVFALAIAAKARGDDVRLSGALAKLLDEDHALTLSHEGDTHQTLLSGQSEAHLQLTLERLKRRFGLDVETAAPVTPYKETITGAVTQHARHKKQTGGHGQFGDVTVEIRPRARGEGFDFTQKIVGGVVPRQWIPAVEAGVRDAVARGPMGFPVVDVAVSLIDGSYHAVDSSEMAFRTAGRMAMDEGLRKCHPTLLEPVDKVDIHVPNSATSGVTSLLSAKRGQVLGFAPRDGWKGWDTVSGYLPRSERNHLIAELRSLSQGLGSFAYEFDHLAELTGRLADDVVKKSTETAHAH